MKAIYTACEGRGHFFKAKKVFKIHTFGKLERKRLLFVGLGKQKDLTFDLLKESLGAASKALKNMKVSSFSVALTHLFLRRWLAADVAHAFMEAFTMSTYEFYGYKKKSNEPEVHVEAIEFFTNADSKEVETALHIGSAFGNGVNSARTLVNTPGNLLTSTKIGRICPGISEGYNFEVEILDKEEMEHLGMGALLAVNQGSVEPPKMIVLKYNGKGNGKMLSV